MDEGQEGRVQHRGQCGPAPGMRVRPLGGLLLRAKTAISVLCTGGGELSLSLHGRRKRGGRREVNRHQSG